MTNAFDHEKRKPLTTLQRGKLFAARGGLCGARGNGGCGRRIRAGEAWIDEHVHALARGGTNDWENRELRCESCAQAKTKIDLKETAKMKRVYSKHVTPVAQRRPKTRPMPFGRNSPKMRKLDGSIVWRDGREEDEK